MGGPPPKVSETHQMPGLLRGQTAECNGESQGGPAGSRDSRHIHTDMTSSRPGALSPLQKEKKVAKVGSGAARGHCVARATRKTDKQPSEHLGGGTGSPRAMGRTEAEAGRFLGRGQHSPILSFRIASSTVPMCMKLLQAVPGTGGRHGRAEQADSGVSKAEPRDLPTDPRTRRGRAQPPRHQAC